MTTEQNKKREERRQEQLKDRLAYRDTLQNRLVETEKKLADTNKDIKTLRG